MYSKVHNRSYTKGKFSEPIKLESKTKKFFEPQTSTWRATKGIFKTSEAEGLLSGSFVNILQEFICNSIEWPHIDNRYRQYTNISYRGDNIQTLLAVELVKVKYSINC